MIGSESPQAEKLNNVIIFFFFGGGGGIEGSIRGERSGQTICATCGGARFLPSTVSWSLMLMLGNAAMGSAE